MTRWIGVLATSACATLTPDRSSAQLVDLQPGVRIRVTAPPLLASRYDAVIGTRRGDTLTLVQEGRLPVDVTIPSLATLQIHGGGSSSCETSNGEPGLAEIIGGSMLWGAGIGALIGRTRWETVDLAPRTGRAAPAAVSPLGVGLRVAF